MNLTDYKYYLLEKRNRIFDSFFHRYLGLRKKEIARLDEEIDKIETELHHKNYLQFIEEISCEKYNPPNKYNE